MSVVKLAAAVPLPAAGRRPLVLIAEDGATDRHILEVFVRREGWNVVAAVDGLHAVELFEQHRPDIVLMDALMPRMNGFEAARRIKLAAGEAMVPIIFLTSLQETKELLRCLEAGGDDFLSKPYNKVILGAKLAKYEQMRLMHEQLRVEREKVAQSNAHLLREQAVAKAVFDNIIRSRGLELPNLKHHLSPLAIFNGDVLLSSRTPDGGLNVFLGDFTGHGLPAAIGALPTAEIFYGMSAKGFGVGDVVAEINRKLHRVLPVGVFCCASMAHFDFGRSQVRIWHGGLPDAVIYRASTRALESVGSHHLPLGVASPAKFKATTLLYELAPADRLVLCSDGVIEARNGAGEMFGFERYCAVMRSVASEADLFESVRAAVFDFIGANACDDDFTLAEVAMVPAAEFDALPAPKPDRDASGPSAFRLQYELKDESLRAFNPLPMLQQLMHDVPGLRGFTSGLNTVLAELYANALDHGVLGLDSRLKDSSGGFAAFFNERTRRLQTLVRGSVSIEMEHRATDGGGELRIRVADSGAGFDHRRQSDSLADERALSGRGIALVRRLCESVCYSGDGNRVEALYRWSHLT